MLPYGRFKLYDIEKIAIRAVRRKWYNNYLLPTTICAGLGPTDLHPFSDPLLFPRLCIDHIDHDDRVTSVRRNVYSRGRYTYNGNH